MYAWIWRKLPFGLAGKLAGSIVLAVAAVALLWYFVFPWVEPLMPFDDVQVTQESGTPGGPGGGDPDVTTAGPTDDDYDLHYNTHENNPPPSTR